MGIVKEIILLSSVGDTGKTTTINLAFEKVMKEYEVEAKLPVETRRNVDFRNYVEIKNKEKTRIGFCSRADRKKDVEKNIEFFKDHECNICITASRTRGHTLDLIHGFAREQETDIFIVDEHVGSGNTNDSNLAANTEKANMILDRVSHLL